MRLNHVLFLTLGLTLVVFVGPTWADDDLGVSVREVTFTDTNISSEPNKMCPVTGSGGQMGVLNVGLVEGDLQGTITVCLNFSPDPGTPVLLRLSGFFEVATDNGVTWSGPFDGLASMLEVMGDFVGTGNDGSTMRGSFTLIGPGKFLDQAVIIGGTDDDDDDDDD